MEIIIVVEKDWMDKMNLEKIQEDIQREINFVKSCLEDLNEYGDGHHNAIYDLLHRQTILKNYSVIASDFESLIRKTQEVIKRREGLSYELDKKSFPRLDEIVEKIGGYDTVWVMTAMNENLVNRDELQEFMQRRKVIQDNEYGEKFLEIGSEIKSIHEDYIKLLETCVEN